ncbi:MAG: hypothetical protein V3T30_07160 [Thermodesulfobacteriota bacterium]
MTPLFKTDKFKLAVILFGSFLITFYLLWYNLYADWGIIDDHKVLFYLGPDGKLKLGEIPGMLFSTEVGKFGVASRFRPSYFILLLTECFLWGNSPITWYLVRLIVLVLSISICWWLVQRKVGLFAGAVFTLYLLTFSFWSRMWTRLLTAEIYAVFGVALFSLGFANLYASSEDGEGGEGKGSPRDWILLFVGAFIAMGVKENFLILLLPAAILFVVFIKRRALGVFSLASLALIFGYGIFIASAIVVALSREKVDIYQNPVNASDRLSLIGTPLIHLVLNNYFLILFAALMLAVFFIYRHLKSKGESHRAKLLLSSYSVYLIAFLALLILYISQYVFYNGHWPVGNRYDFPGVLAMPFFYLFSVVFILRMATLVKSSGAVRIAILTVFSLALVYSIYVAGFSEIREASRANGEASTEFSLKLSRIVETLSRDKRSNLLLVINDPVYYEHLVSVPRFLRARGVENPLYLWVPEFPAETVASEKNRLLAEHLKFYSRKGSKGYLMEGIKKRPHGFNPGVEPIGEFHKSKQRCYSISFVGPATAAGCTEIVD